MDSTRPRVLVVGCGAIGGTVAGALQQPEAESAAEVIGLSTNPVITEAIRSQGYRLTGVPGDRVMPGRVVEHLDADTKPFDWIMLATQPPQMETAAREVLPWLAPEGRLVSFQNGLCEERLARIVGPERVVGAIVGWGASMPEPGVYEQTSEGGFTIGALDGSHPPHLDALALLLEAVGPVDISTNLRGARWSKLAINCAISTLGTIGGDRLGALMRYRYVRRLALEIMSEVVAVARAEGVQLQKVSGTLDLDWLALTPAERASTGSVSLVAKHTMLLAVGTRYRRLRSSMLSAIERGRPPAVDFLNGEVVERGLLHSIPTPVNAAARDMVHRIARRELSSSMQTLEQLANEVGVVV